MTEEQPVNKLSQIVTMKGAKTPYNFFKIEYGSTSKGMTIIPDLYIHVVLLFFKLVV